MRSAAVLAFALLALCAAPQAAIGQDAATVTTTFNLYGNSVEPFDGTKESAIKTSLAQSAGHGVTADNIKITVDKTYADQQKNGRRLLQDANLVQPGVQLTSAVETTQQLATSVSQSIDSALGNNQIAQVFNQNGGQADYTAIVTASNTGGSSGGSNGGDVNSGNNGSGNNTSSGNSSSSGSGDKKSFPGWAIAVVVVLVLLLVGVIVGYCVWRKRAANRGVRAEEFGSAAYFNDGTTEKGEGIGAKISGAFAGVSAGAAGLAAKFKRAPPQVVQPAPAEPGLTRNPATPFSQIGFTGAGAASPGITRTTSGGAGNNYAGFVTRGPTTPKGSSLPTANPLYTAPPKTPGAGSYTPRRTGRLESLRDINDV